MNVYEIARRFRDQLLDYDASAAQHLSREFQRALDAIKADINEIIDAAVQAEKAGGGAAATISSFQQARLRDLIARIERQLATFGQLAAGEITRSQMLVTELAERQVSQIMRLAGADAAVPQEVRLSASFFRAPIEATAQMAGFLGDGTPLTRLVDEFSAAAAPTVRAILTSGMAQGQNPRKIAGKIVSVLGVATRDRALRVARTEVLRSYRETSLQNYQANSDVIEGWVWLSALDRRTCPVCWAMHGTFHELSEPFGSHVNCRCSPAPKIIGVPSQIPSGEEKFSALDAKTQEVILGPATYKAYAAGKITLPELVEYHEHPEWGPQRTRRSLKAAMPES